MNKKTRITMSFTRNIRISIKLILILSILNSACFAKDISQPNAGYSVLNMSKSMSYSLSKTYSGQPITFEISNDGPDKASMTMKVQSSNYPIEPELDTKTEKKQIAMQNKIVTRTGRTLTIKRPSASPFVFKDYSKPAKNNKEGDSQKYVYAGPLGGTGYHMVETTYMHDSPGTYFVNPNVDTMLYAHTSDHSVYLSANNRLLIINNSPNPPFGLVIASLSEKGHKIELHCTSHISNDPKLRSQFEGWDNKVNGEFKGWHESPEIGFDLLVKLPNTGENAKQNKDSLPVQFSFSSGQWHIFVPDTKQKHLSYRLSCWQ